MSVATVSSPCVFVWSLLGVQSAALAVVLEPLELVDPQPARAAAQRAAASTIRDRDWAGTGLDGRWSAEILRQRAGWWR